MAVDLPQSRYTVNDLYKAAREAGFNGPQAIIATAISLAEDSSMDPYAISPRNADGSYDHGAWQINDRANAAIIARYGNVNDLNDNARMAYAVFRRQGWGAWTTYRTGAYKANVGMALKANKFYASGQGASALEKAGLQGIAGIIAPGSTYTTNPLNPFGGITTVGSFLTHLSDPALWKRIGLGVAAAALLLFGVLLMLGSNKTVRETAVKAGEVAAVA